MKRERQALKIDLNTFLKKHEYKKYFSEKEDEDWDGDEDE